ncbi:uroporphyrinogen decarboxylase [Gordonia sp. Z-3]|uniref:uroporphyrinogen decarboxylase n=1 Tax=unclassified Gordonia (in: high G+C Gram-positive bacteria) TaxID=2657482 RepID=UPI000C3D19B6|nr:MULTISPECIES: uroporphyrinogen decarboxylase [unclassified Gordonia (in: high G+C Gram-positive bacteria)]MAU82835.1 uroporphyrinogen decarboxylase [Gordonia sp. (in: high G+C Gram-positive bacteria)]MED5800247.1 uroporphyrinogen decarboxylase [Gordonia sp. Z-3]
MSETTRSSARRAHDLPLVAAARGASPERRPVWFMRQAGRSLPEYRAIRADHGMLESCFDPALVCEITMQPVRRHDVDAAILFSDIVVPLKAAGIDLDIVAGTGPVIANPVRDAADVANLPRLEEHSVGAIAHAIELILDELPDKAALIGFAGAPFTLASYLIEGGPSRHYERTKALMHGDPETWHALMGRLADITITFLRVQLDAGIDALQLFDSWAGMLSLADYQTYVAPHSSRVFAEVADHDVPRIHFGVGTGELLGAMAEAGADVIGVDWRVPLDEAVRRVGPGKAVQGNLDPTLMFAGSDVVEREVRRVVADGDRAVRAGATGHIFNLGHGVLPSTDPDVITRAVELVHSL